MNNLTLVIWKCAYDRIVYIVKKGINIFSKKWFLRGWHNVFVPPPYTNALIRHCFIGVLYFYWGILFYRDVEYNFPRKDLFAIIVIIFIEGL